MSSFDSKVIIYHNIYVSKIVQLLLTGNILISDERGIDWYHDITT